MKKFLATSAALLALVSASGCASSSDNSNGTASQGGDKSSKQATGSTKGKGPMKWGNWQVVGKIQTKGDALDQFDSRFRVKNTGQSPDEGAFTLTYLKRNKILGSVDCTTAKIAPSQIGAARCFSTDDFVPGWTEIQVENTY